MSVHRIVPHCSCSAPWNSQWLFVWSTFRGALRWRASAAEMRNKSCPIVTFQTERKGGFEFNIPDSTRQYSFTKHAMRRSADELGATAISFGPKGFSDP